MQLTPFDGRNDLTKGSLFVPIALETIETDPSSMSNNHTPTESDTNHNPGAKQCSYKRTRCASPAKMGRLRETRLALKSSRLKLAICLAAATACLLVALWRKPSNYMTHLLRLNHDQGHLLDKSDQVPERTFSRDQHPIQSLVQVASDRFDEILQRQSRTLRQATREYIRRYQRSPPPGFDKWFEYATAHKSPIIDEYDVLDDSIAPLLARSGLEVLESVQATLESSVNVWSCQIRKGALDSECEHFGEVFLRLFANERIMSNIPNVQLIVNGLDEPRVVLDRRTSSRIHQQENGFSWRDLSHRNAWEELVHVPCQRESNVMRRASHSPQTSSIDTFRVPLVQNQTEGLDLCQHPDYEHASGLWQSPDTLKVTGVPVPMLSPAVLSTTGDIPFPALAYSNDAYAYDESESVALGDKVPGLYWAGKNTGSFQGGDSEGWKTHHRQRFVALTNNLESKYHIYLERNVTTNEWEPIEDEYLNTLSYNVHFTGLVQCEESACHSQKQYFGLHVSDARSDALKYTLAFDLDGNGHSGRYYRLLESRSLPLKQTVFREWHDDRLIAWLHYVPISIHMEELPEVVRYFVEEEEGRELAQELAMKGREWAQKALTTEEQFIYLYRTILEVARLQDPDRRAIVR
ncbi:hypothetical protein AC579_7036 [Pseudocercospora musae]|uniref:Glycosyl transferase CAP10 domain-containing protein n=1 Tax=Pseudocercospora musae TaxID=113226 RepID=A0A139IAG2_9PEZI|nr:hypothetical protein AC579_7036 [Pseudocercospora musae]